MRVKAVKKTITVVILVTAACYVLWPLLIYLFIPHQSNKAAKAIRKFDLTLFLQQQYNVVGSSSTAPSTPANVAFLIDNRDFESKPSSIDVVSHNNCTRNGLKGDLHLSVNKINFFLTFQQIAEANPDLQPGGRFRPSKCRLPDSERLAVVIPYRNRDIHLRALLYHLHPILQRQQLDYQVFVVEQAGRDVFNKALLMNAAFKESQRLANFSCYIFHDVDLLPEDDRGIYECGDVPMHLSEYVDMYGYEPFRDLTENDVLFGGVVSIRRRVFEIINGYSNVFFGWGGEDEEMATRLRLHKFPVRLPDPKRYRYKMFKHNKDVRNPQNYERFFLMKRTASRMFYDGLSSAKYQLVDVRAFPTHTRLLIGFDRNAVLENVFTGKDDIRIKKRQ